MDRLRDWALKLIIALNVIALTVSFYESFAGLYQWAQHHSITGFAAAVFPLMIDVMILVGEAGLFVAHHGHWRVRDKAWLWFVTLTALGVSAAGNVGHVVSTDWLSHLTASLPPVALFFSMTVGFGVMKRVYLNKPQARVETSQPALVFPPVPPSQVLTETRESPLTETSHAVVETPLTPLTETLSPTAESPLTETSHEPAENTSHALTDTLLSLGFKATEKSFTMPRDPREELTLPEKRTRDMYDVDPDISTNGVAKSLGIAWQTADKYLKATKEARGLPA